MQEFGSGRRRSKLSRSEGRTALITGCSSGFGLSLTVALAREGWRVIASMRNTFKRSELDEALQEHDVAGRVEVVTLDVCDEVSIADAVTRLSELTDRLDLVVHNAGVAVNGYFEEMSVDEQCGLLATNLIGVMNLTRAVLPMLREHGSSRIVFMSSQAAFCPLPGLAVYTAAKAGVEGFAECLAVELLPFGIDVKIIEPGGFRTALMSNMQYVGRTDGPYSELSGALHARTDVLERFALGSVDKAVQRMLPSLTGERRRMRLVVGVDAYLMWTVKHVLPWRLRRRLYCLAMGVPSGPSPRPRVAVALVSSP